MPTATAGRRSTSRLELTIDGKPYSVRVLPLGDAAEAFVQYQLTKRDGEHYTVSVPLDGIPCCDCPDWTYRRDQIDRASCKHVRAMRALGLLNMTWVEREEVADGDLVGAGPPAAATEIEPPMSRAIAIEPDVADILRRSEVSANNLFLKLPGQLDRKTYERVNKVLGGLGGRWDRHAGAHFFDRPISGLLDEALGAGSVVKNPLAFFPTPDPVVARMIGLARLDRRRPGEPQKLRVLEPSAGDGAIVEALHAFDRHVEEVVAVELDPVRAARIPVDESAIDVNVIVGDFLGDVGAPGDDGDGEPIHRVLMNPPFAAPGEPHAYWLHVMRAYDLLAEGGRLVAVCPVGFTFATRPRELVDFRDFVEQFGEVVNLPDDAFRESGTGVRACLVVLDK